MMAFISRRPGRTCAAASILSLFIYTAFQLMYLPVDLQICPDPADTPHFYMSDQSEDDITVVTMYLNIGAQEAKSFWFFTYTLYASSYYEKWMFGWAKLQNRVIAFFDNDEFISNFKKLRNHLPESYTTIVKISKDQLKAFDQLDKIKEIVPKAKYKTTYPPEYTCTMNAKYDVLDIAFDRGLVKTKYVAWADFGLWRKITEQDISFTIKPPPLFNSSRVGFSEVTARERLSSLSPLEIYQKNIVKVAGGFVLGTQPVLQEFLKSYRIASAELLQQGLADTDQQIIASMYSPAMRKKQNVDVETYACPRGSFGLFGHAYIYFCLPYICRASAQCMNRVI